MRAMIRILFGFSVFALAIARTANADEPAARTVVVAEGVGTGADDAVKDALRNAVRQVVGAVVDAQTLVKDDKIIADKVITYSGGFVKAFQELDKSERQGLFRVRIAAEVERRAVVAKLNEANVKVTAVDGKGLFAEVVTDLEASKNAKSLLASALKDFPRNSMTAAVVGKPAIESKKEGFVSARFDIEVKPDMKAYESAALKLKDVLDRIALDKGEFTLTYQRLKDHFDANFVEFTPKESGFLDDQFSLWMPKAVTKWKRLRPDRVVVALATQRTERSDRFDYRYYLLDNESRATLVDVAFILPKGKLTLTDPAGKTIASDRFDLVDGKHYEGTLIMPVKNHLGSGDIYVSSRAGRGGGDVENEKKFSTCFFISPAFLRGSNRLEQRPSFVLNRTVTLSLDELKSVQAAKVELLSE